MLCHVPNCYHVADVVFCGFMLPVYLHGYGLAHRRTSSTTFTCFLYLRGGIIETWLLYDIGRPLAKSNYGTCGTSRSLSTLAWRTMLQVVSLSTGGSIEYIHMYSVPSIKILRHGGQGDQGPMTPPFTNINPESSPLCYHVNNIVLLLFPHFLALVKTQKRIRALIGYLFNALIDDF